MKFGVREICDVTFKAKSDVYIGKSLFKKGQPVLYIDSAKTSTIEGAATTVYAQGGKGNSRLIAWEGEKTLTFTVEDALLSPIGFAVLSGAGLFDASESEKVMVHCTAQAVVDATKGTITLDDSIAASAPVFVMLLDNGSFSGLIEGITIDDKVITVGEEYKGKTVWVDYYVEKSEAVTEIQIDANNFAGYYYVEASTLFRRESDGVDMPAEITFPNVKIQSNFTFTMASSGDPSTFTFTMDAMPGYTAFDKTKKVLCVMQVVNENSAKVEEAKSVMNVATDEEIDSAKVGTKYVDSRAEITVAD